MKYCPICCEALQPGTVCTCGYDPSCDYENALSLVPAQTDTLTVNSLRKRYLQKCLDEQKEAYEAEIAALNFQLMLAGTPGAASSDILTDLFPLTNEEPAEPDSEDKELQTAADTAYAQEQYEPALENYLQLAKHGSVSNDLRIGMMYEQGQGTRQNLLSARQWYTAALLHGNPEAAEKIRNLVENSGNLKQVFQLLSNKRTHKAACAALTAGMLAMDPCAAIMLAFMYQSGWAEGCKAEEILLTAQAMSEPDEWFNFAEKFQENDREHALAYYIGYSMLKHNLDGYKMAAYLAVRLVNFELTKECFRLAGVGMLKERVWYDEFSKMNEDEFCRKVAGLNKK